ncbi:PAS domain-containing sensor histidine kinase [Halarchaeum nitratireducens]|uniref:histidine kinase n=1 Tax=Halarchaeum nitratireducens TaxID=489913 RepID=A0A830GD16_9EURY|nr:PAS domain S-box protein [Halarchaeum nitratireducens]GGN20163.1 hypothetical protein GCM10009021_21610 [Halarchaeum nitratireducens]
MEDAHTNPERGRRAFREAVESTGHAIYWTDTTATIEYVNPAFEEQTGYTAAEAVGSDASILQSGVHDERFYERLWDTILGGEIWEGEIVNQRADGERYVVEQTISPIADDGGEIVRFVAVNEDVTERREYRDRLERERDRFASLLNAVPVPLVLIAFDREDPRVEQVNRAFDETFGFAADELEGAALDAHIVDDARREQAREINERVRRGEQVRREVVRRTAAGEERTFLLTATALDGESSTECLATYLDITERERARAELERRTEDLEDFANVVSHDLRSPLNVASGYLDLVADEHDSPHIDTVRSAHERMRELIENVLTLARQGKSVDETYPVSIADVATDSWSTVETADATLDVETTRTIDADEARLRQLFGNLVRNAVEHGGSDVTVTVGDLADGSGFYVADDGPGIDPAERERVFDRGHTSTESGTGLGLSIVQEIVDAHGWEIVITESAAGGARFEIAGVERPDR